MQAGGVEDGAGLGGVVGAGVEEEALDFGEAEEVMGGGAQGLGVVGRDGFVEVAGGEL